MNSLIIMIDEIGTYIHISSYFHDENIVSDFFSFL